MRACIPPFFAVVVAGCQFQPTLEVTAEDAVDARCPAADGETLALYTFDQDDGTTIADAHGAHPGTLHNASVPPLIDGPQGCGSAMAFPEGLAAGSEVFVEVPDHGDWQLAVGSIDLWVNPAAPGLSGTVGIVSRDARETVEAGHFSLYQWTQTEPERLVVRIQQMDDPVRGRFLCADEPVVPGRWTHVGINFGPPAAELWIDGELATNRDVIDPTQPDRLCNEANTTGIDGNTNPWALGVDTSHSEDGAATPVKYPFAGGAIDHVRVSRVRREFAAPGE